MLTRRQKNSIRGITAAMTCVVLLSAFLIYTNISNAEKTEPVVFSDILEGAVAYADSSDEPSVTLAQDELMETMFSEKYATFTLPDEPPYTPSAVNTEDTLSYTDDTTHSFEGLQDPNEITLLSDELELFRTESSTTETSSATSPNGNAYGYASSQTTSASTTLQTYFITGPTTRPTEPIPITVPTTRRSEASTKSSSSSTTKEKTTTSSKTTSATTAPPNTSSHTSKTPFINVGGGVFSNDDNVYLTLLKLVNNARREAGVKELWYSARVHDVCVIRATELSSYYSHNRPDGSWFSTAFKEIGIKYAKCGENIAYGRNTFTTAEEVFKAWMDSESHRENILNPDFECAAFGLSVLEVDNDTYYYWTQEFAKF